MVKFMPKNNDEARLVSGNNLGKQGWGGGWRFTNTLPLRNSRDSAGEQVWTIQFPMCTGQGPMTKTSPLCYTT